MIVWFKITRRGNVRRKNPRRYPCRLKMKLLSKYLNGKNREKYPFILDMREDQSVRHANGGMSSQEQ